MPHKKPYKFLILFLGNHHLKSIPSLLSYGVFWIVYFFPLTSLFILVFMGNFTCRLYVDILSITWINLSRYTTVGRSFFSTNLGPRGELGDGIEYWRGYYQSLRPTQMGLSFNVGQFLVIFTSFGMYYIFISLSWISNLRITDVSARSFFEPIMVTDFLAKYFRMRDMSSPLLEQDRIKVWFFDLHSEFEWVNDGYLNSVVIFIGVLCEGNE